MKKITFVFILVLSVVTLGFAQSHKMSNGGSIFAKGSGMFYDDGGADADHGNNKTYTQTFHAPAGQELTFKFSAFDLGINDYLYIYDGSSTNASLIGNYTRTSNPGTIRSTSGSLTFYFTSDNSGSGAGWTARYNAGQPDQVMTGGTSCATANPFCTDSFPAPNFPNATGQPSLGGGGIYGCLGSTPNPIWYNMQIQNPGDIHITINQTTNGGSGIDVDFVCWGPFASLAAGCGALSSGNIVDCSYSASATEYCDITGAQTGQVYILLLTNYNGGAGHITFNESNLGQPGAATTNCGILCATINAPASVCSGTTFTLSPNNPPSGANNFSWTGSNSFSATTTTATGVTVTAPSVPGPGTSMTYTYSLTVTTSGGATCTAATKTVTIYQTPTANAGTASPITCAQPNSLLDGSSPNVPGATITWQGPGISGTATDPHNTSQAGTYTVTAASQGCSSTATVAVTTNTTAPVPSIATPNGTTLNCLTPSVTLDGSATPSGATVAWPGQGTNPLSVSAPGTYTLVATNPSNGCTAQAQVSVISDSGPPNVSITNITGAVVLSCRHDSIVLAGGSTTAGVVGGWSGPSGGIIGDTITVTVPGQYMYQVTNTNNGCQSSSTVNITQDTAHPSIQITAPNTLLTCTQTAVSLTGTSTATTPTFAWSHDSIAVSGNPISVTDSGTYVLVVTDPANGCTSTLSQTVTKDLTPPDIAINAPNTVLTCVVTSISLQGTSNTAGATFAWDGPTGASTNNPLATSTPGTYTVTVTNPTNGCTSMQNVVTTEDVAQPNVSYTTPDGTVIDCNTSQVHLQGTSTLGTATFQWTGSSGNIPGNPAVVGSPDTYTLTATNPVNGCSSDTTVVITANGSVPNISYTSSAPNITCSTTAITLTGSSTTPGVTITWANSTGPVGNPYNATAAGSYTLSVTDNGTGCTATNIAAVGMDTLRPNESIFSSVTTLTCASPTATLTGASTTPGATFSWSGPSGSLPGNPVSINTSATYSLTVTNPSNGCSRTQTVGISTNTVAPVVSISSPSTVLTCANTTIPVTATGSPSSVNYQWSGVAVGSNSTVNGNNPGTYSVTVTDPANGCTGSTSLTLTQNTTPPPVTTGGGGPVDCFGSLIPLTGSSPISGATFVWNGPGQFVDSTANSSSATAGNYTLTVTDPVNGCTATGVVAITPNPNVPNANAGANQIVKCNKTFAVLTGSSTTTPASNLTFSWAYPTDIAHQGLSLINSPTAAVCTTSVAAPHTYTVAAGTYTLTVTNTVTGCKAQDQVVVTATPAPNAGFTATPVEGYVPLSVFFTNTSTNSNNYSWHFDETNVATTLPPTPNVASTSTATTTYNEGGTYTVILVSSVAGACKDTAYVTIEVKEPTEVVIPNIFSPNGDDQNDWFLPAKLKAVDELTIDVWDRWGKHVKTFDGKTGHWDGNGSSDGTYFYVAKGRGTDKSEIEQTGFVLLVRAK
jgi:gliding motility-associated-like protein